MSKGKSHGLSWGLIGFGVGVLLGFGYSEKASSKLSESVKTDIKGGVVSVSIDTKKALKAGLPDWLGL